jgi:hypothetical protein
MANSSDNLAVAAGSAVAIATAALLCWDRKYHNVVPLSGATVAAQRLATLVWACSMLCILSTAIAISWSRTSKQSRSTWPWFECGALILVILYTVASDEIWWVKWPLRGDATFVLFYAVNALTFVTASVKAVRGLNQRLWLKAGASLIVLLLAGAWTLTSSAMILWFT